VSSDEPVIYAGIKEARARADRLANGIPLHAKVVETLRALCAELGTESTV
jgi:LDH2 family malate/lactate/ureidoglycolate dehydrogenase